MGFLRQPFGPSKEEIWRQLCTEIGAQYVDGGFWTDDKVQAHHGQWTITLDTYTETEHSMFAEVLDRLCQIGSAYENDPQTAL